MVVLFSLLSHRPIPPTRLPTPPTFTQPKTATLPTLLSYRPLPPPHLPNRLALTQLQTVTPTTSAQLPYVYSAKDRYSHHACPNPLRLFSYRPLLPPRLPNRLAFTQLQTVTPPRLPNHLAFIQLQTVTPPRLPNRLKFTQLQKAPSLQAYSACR